jgi:ribosomal protein L14E/L6E/L27E
MQYLTQEEQEILHDLLTLSAESSQDKEFEVAEVVDENFVITTEGDVEVNPELNIDVDYNKAIARQSNNDEDKRLYNKALEKQREENEKDLALYNKALKKQLDKKARIERKRKETGLRLV